MPGEDVVVNEYSGIDEQKEAKYKALLARILDRPIMVKADEKQVGGNHYKDFVIQPGIFCQKNSLNYFESNAIKYACRHRLKGTGRQDIEKAIHYLELLLEEEYPE